MPNGVGMRPPNTYAAAAIVSAGRHAILGHVPSMTSTANSAPSKNSAARTGGACCISHPVSTVGSARAKAATPNMNTTSPADSARRIDSAIPKSRLAYSGNDR
jgi:hypothetical protein